MSELNLLVKRISNTAKLPTKAHESDMCFDLYSDRVTIAKPNSLTKIYTGIACKFPNGYGGLIQDRSSISTQKELFKVAGVIDAGYRGEIVIVLRNPTKFKIIVNSGEKIAQLQLVEQITANIVEVNELDSTDRNDRGFGSTGTS